VDVMMQNNVSVNGFQACVPTEAKNIVVTVGFDRKACRRLTNVAV
jgi:hypothetical protein